MIQNNVNYEFSVDAFAKLVTLMATVELLQPGSINFMIQTAAMLADDWKIRRTVNNVPAAETLFREFEEWLNSKGYQPEETPQDSGFTAI